MSWADTIRNCHLAVTNKVSHHYRMKSDRYFVWQEDGYNGHHTDNMKGDIAVTGSTDLFTTLEFDPWAEQLEAQFNAAGVAWNKTSVQYDEDRGKIIHHEWRWEVLKSG